MKAKDFIVQMGRHLDWTGRGHLMHGYDPEFGLAASVRCEAPDRFVVTYVLGRSLSDWDKKWLFTFRTMGEAKIYAEKTWFERCRRRQE